MKFDRLKRLTGLAALGLVLGACGNSTPTNSPTAGQSSASTQQTDGKFKVGLILVRPKNDAGWSQAHYEGIEYVIFRQLSKRRKANSRVSLFGLTWIGKT